jgi:conjugal transfer pilus assembly protein TraK
MTIRKSLLAALILAFAAQCGAAESGVPDPSPQKSIAPKKRVQEQALPGVGVMPGDPRMMRANVVRVGTDHTEVIYASNQFHNRISTPFQNPVAVDQNEAEVIPKGQSLYVLPKTDKPVVLYISDDKPNSPVVSVMLVPRNIPPQTVILQMDTPGARAVGDAEEATSDSYTGKIRYLMRSVALGRAPDGYAEGALPKSVVKMGALLVAPERRYSGAYMDIYRYRVENTGETEIELSEASFYQDGVRAVAIFPVLKLAKAQSTTVFVIADKSAIRLDGGENR